MVGVQYWRNISGRWGAILHYRENVIGCIDIEIGVEIVRWVKNVVLLSCTHDFGDKSLEISMARVLR